MTRSSVAVLCGVVFLQLASSVPVRAQFGFFYGGPQQPRRVYRPRARHLPPRVPAPAPQKDVEIPLPTPRPHFPGDPPLPAAAAGDAPSKTEQPAAPVGAPGKTADKPVDPQAPPASPASPQKPPLGPPLPPMPPAKPPEVAKPAAPGVAPSGAKLGETPRQPEDDASCPSRLQARNVVVEPTSIGPQPDSRCTVVQAVKLVSLALPDGGKVDFPEHPTVACTTADTFSSFVRDLLSPLAKGALGSPVSTVWTGPGLECRSMDHIVGAKLSAHGQGLAIDIAQLKLADGRMIEVGQAKNEAGQAFETAARNAACGYFHTVLGPGTDSYHRTHWHFDLLVRGAQGDSKYCR